jgi:hypothetical protein
VPSTACEIGPPRGAQAAPYRARRERGAPGSARGHEAIAAKREDLAAHRARPPERDPTAAEVADGDGGEGIPHRAERGGIGAPLGDPLAVRGEDEQRIGGHRDDRGAARLSGLTDREGEDPAREAREPAHRGERGARGGALAGEEERLGIGRGAGLDDAGRDGPRVRPALQEERRPRRDELSHRRELAPAGDEPRAHPQEPVLSAGAGARLRVAATRRRHGVAERRERRVERGGERRREAGGPGVHLEEQRPAPLQRRADLAREIARDGVERRGGPALPCPLSLGRRRGSLGCAGGEGEGDGEGGEGGEGGAHGGPHP